MAASDSRVNNHTALATLVRRARRRHILLLLADQTALVFSVVLGGAVVLLIAGTQILDWYWLAALFAAAVAAGIYRGRKAHVSPYQLTRCLDRNLGLEDALSTALFFSEHPDRTKAPQDVVERQRAMADDMARMADLHRGLPYTGSRALYISAGLAMAALGVFGLRYGVTRTLDLRPSLVQIAFDGFLNTGARQVAETSRKQRNDPRAKDWANPSTLKYDPWQANPMDQTGAPDSALNTVDTPNVDNSNKTGPAADPKAQGSPSKDQADSSADNPENGDPGSGTPDQAPDGSQPPSQNGKKAGVPPGAQPQRDQNAENSSLTDKMRDALANLLSKLKMQPKGGNSKSGQQQGQNGSQQMAQNRQGNNQNGSPMPGKSQQDAMASPDGQASQDAQTSQQAKAGQGKSNGKSDDHAKSQDGKSGIGSQDGDKSIKEAEQLAAMGKISEIIGKRAQNVAGEVMVEVASGNQQLRTQYTQRKASHADTGGEISRDEVPLAYQQYVQQYFEEIRKLPATAAKSKGAKPADAPKGDPAKKPAASTAPGPAIP